MTTKTNTNTNTNTQTVVQNNKIQFCGFTKDTHNNKIIVHFTNSNLIISNKITKHTNGLEFYSELQYQEVEVESPTIRIEPGDSKITSMNKGTTLFSLIVNEGEMKLFIYNSIVVEQNSVRFGLRAKLVVTNQDNKE